MDHGMASCPWNCLLRSLPRGLLEQAGPRKGQGPGIVLCFCIAFVARAATFKKPDGSHLRVPDVIGARELGAAVALSLHLCGIMGKKNKRKSFAWFLIFHRERLNFDNIVIWRPWVKRPMAMLTLVRNLQRPMRICPQKACLGVVAGGLDLSGLSLWQLSWFMLTVTYSLTRDLTIPLNCFLFILEKKICSSWYAIFIPKEWL